MKGLPTNFFEKSRPNVRDIQSIQKDPNDEIIPFAWSKDVLDGKFKDKVILKMPQFKSETNIRGN